MTTNVKTEAEKPGKMNGTGHVALFRIVLSIASVLLFGLTAFVANKTFDNAVEIHAIQETKFTAEDGQRLRANLIRQQQAAIDEFRDAFQNLRECIILLQHGSNDCDP